MIEGTHARQAGGRHATASHLARSQSRLLGLLAREETDKKTSSDYHTTTVLPTELMKLKSSRAKIHKVSKQPLMNSA